MPIPLNAEQAASVAQMVEYVSAGDFAAGYACLELFPQSDPLGPGAPLGVNLGDAFLTRLAQAQAVSPVDPRIAVPALRSFVPALEPVRAAEFIAYCQTRLRDEATAPAVETPPPGSLDPDA